MTPGIKAIDTQYKGYRFRSRLEARWAVFFDAIGLTWEYEKEGYELGDELGRYLCDFWFPEINFWVEIKGSMPTEIEHKRAQALAIGTQRPVAILAGDIGGTNDEEGFWSPTYNAFIHFGTPRLFGRNIHNNSSECWIVCDFINLDMWRLAQFVLSQGKTLGPVSNTESLVDSIISADKQYYLERYGSPHPKYPFGMMIENAQIIEAQGGRFQRIQFSEQEIAPGEQVIRAFSLARQSRFEHGETPQV